MEKPHKWLDECPRILLTCFRARNSVHRGKTVHAAPQYYSIAERAKSVLHPKVVKYINHAFTKKGMKEHRMGRRRNNYTKRSQGGNSIEEEK